MTLFSWPLIHFRPLGQFPYPHYSNPLSHFCNFTLPLHLCSVFSPFHLPGPVFLAFTQYSSSLTKSFEPTIIPWPHVPFLVPFLGPIPLNCPRFSYLSFTLFLLYVLIFTFPSWFIKDSIDWSWSGSYTIKVFLVFLAFKTAWIYTENNIDHRNLRQYRVFAKKVTGLRKHTQ